MSPSRGTEAHLGAVSLVVADATIMPAGLASCLQAGLHLLGCLDTEQVQPLDEDAQGEGTQGQA